MIRFLIFLCFSLTTNLRSAPPENLELVFNAIKNLDYEVARNQIKNVESEDYRLALMYLSEIIEKHNFKIDRFLPKENKELEYKYIVKLIQGYENKYLIEIESIDVFKEFAIALKISQELKSPYLEKAALISILNLFTEEIFIGSKQYLIYLKRFNEIKSDSSDEVYSILFSSIFDSKEKSLQASYFKMMSRLDSVFKKLPKSSPLFNKYYFEKGIQYKVSNPEKAIDFFMKADSMAQQQQNQDAFRSSVAWQLSNLNFWNDSLIRAKAYLNIARKLSIRLRDTFYNDRLASAIFKKEGNYDSAYHYLRKSVDIEYELGYKNNTLESSILTVQNQTDKLKLDKLELETSNVKIRNWAIFLGTLLILGSLIGILIYKNTKRKQLLAEQEKTLQQQKVSNLLKEQELTTIDAMIEGQEKERQRVANELHDDLGSLMAAVKLQFNSLEATDKKENLETFAKTESLIDEAYGKIRAIAHAKNSGLIAKQGLLQAVKQMAEKVSIASGLNILVHDHGLNNRLENSIELMLFRIIQELITNAIKHAEATEMNIHITNHGETLNILVEDNGKGMLVNAIQADSSGMGLKSIDKRINHLHGTMDVESELGKGTVIILDIPI